MSNIVMVKMVYYDWIATVVKGDTSDNLQKYDQLDIKY